MAVVKLEAMRQLRRAIECAIPELEGKICAGQSPPDRDQPWPNLNIEPGRLAYLPDQAAPVHEPAPDKLVVNVGRFEGACMLKLGAATLGERYELEQRLLDLFLGTDDDVTGPGVLITPVTSCPALGTFVAAWALDDEDWDDEFAFDRRFRAQISLTATIPALVTRCGVYRINHLRLGLADLGVAATPATFGDVADVVEINADGTITPL